jgi:polynucleotide 5'-hydroxyl-kinase GRC3/NOL9
MERQSKDYSRLEIIPEPSWEELFEAILQKNGTVLLIGATNSGKSTLAQYLLRRFTENNVPIAIVDADIGQSSLGIPGTMTMKVFKENEDTGAFHAEKTFFIGSLNPAEKIPLMIEGTTYLVHKARKQSDHILVDTTGLIHGEHGRTLKMGKINTVKPETIVALERQKELEHILAMVRDITVYRMKTSRNAIERSRDMRIRYRQNKFEEYFIESNMHEFFLENVVFYYNGKSFFSKRSDFKGGTVIGLNHNEDTRALGILLELNKTTVTFKSPIASLRGINRVVFGDITINA